MSMKRIGMGLVGPGFVGAHHIDAVRRLGFKPASTMRDALEMATDVVGRDPSVTHLHCPPLLMADVST